MKHFFVWEAATKFINKIFSSDKMIAQKRTSTMVANSFCSTKDSMWSVTQI